MIPQFSNYYDVRDKLGAGAFGTVMRCVKKGTREEFAVKIIEKTMGHAAFEVRMCDFVVFLES